VNVGGMRAGRFAVDKMRAGGCIGRVPPRSDASPRTAIAVMETLTT
jgi:hypothetical protein